MSEAVDTTQDLESGRALRTGVPPLHNAVGDLLAVVRVEHSGTAEVTKPGERGCQRHRHRHLAPFAALRNRFVPLASFTLPDRSLHMNDAALDVDVAPFQGCDLGLPEPRRSREQYQCVNARIEA